MSEELDKKAKEASTQEKREYIAKTLYEYLHNASAIAKMIPDKAHTGFTPQQLCKNSQYSIDQTKALLKSMATYGVLKVAFPKPNRIEYSLNLEMKDADIPVKELIASLEDQAKSAISQAKAYGLVLEVIQEYMNEPDPTDVGEDDNDLLHGEARD
tara:strand:- start:32 stop:499 length:468 start_codon:yes stop_codon:yes gene_type:complete